MEQVTRDSGETLTTIAWTAATTSGFSSLLLEFAGGAIVGGFAPVAHAIHAMATAVGHALRPEGSATDARPTGTATHDSDP
jgi:hypothetical protein